MKEKYLLFTIIAGFLLGRIIRTTESVILKAFALVLTLTIATACAYGYYDLERELEL